MRFFDVKVLFYDDETKSHFVQYSVDKGKGVVRRSKAFLKKGALSRDSDKVKLVDEIKDKVLLYNLTKNK